MTLDAYNITRGFPKDELFGLTSQIRRACASIGANIGEGCGRKTDNDIARFFQIAMGSASEVQYHFLLSYDLHLMGREHYLHLNGKVLEVKRMLAALLSKMRASAETTGQNNNEPKADS